MSGTPPSSAEERARASFVALLLLLREFAQSLLAQGHVADARGVIDGVDALRAKTKGNLSDEETRFLDGILGELHLAVVTAAAREAAGQGEPEEDGDTEPGSGDGGTPGGEER